VPNRDRRGAEPDQDRVAGSTATARTGLIWRAAAERSPSCLCEEPLEVTAEQMNSDRLELAFRAYEAHFYLLCSPESRGCLDAGHRWTDR
jgi:hypothetical protein